MKTIGDQAREFRVGKGWTTQEMAAAVSLNHPDGPVSRQVIEQLEKAGARRPRYMAALAKTMGSTVEDLERGAYCSDLLLRSTPPESLKSGAPILLQDITKAVIRSRVPLVRWETATAIQGGNLNFTAAEVVRYLDVFGDDDTSDTFALLVEGDSMVSQVAGERSFPPGTIIRVRAGVDVDSGHYVIARDPLTGQATFKRLMRDAGRWYLKPLNAAYPTAEISDPRTSVIGRVVKFVVEGEL